MREGNDGVIVGIGPILSEALKASEILNDYKISLAVASLGSIKPIDEKFLQALNKRFARWFSIEEHSIHGGLGSTLLEWSSKNNQTEANITLLGTQDRFIHELGDQNFTRACQGLNHLGIAEQY